MAKLSELLDDLLPVAFVGSGERDPTPIYVYSPRRTKLGDLFRQRPSTARFVVVKDRDKDFLVIDLYRVKLNDDFTTFTMMPDAVEVYPIRAAAIMAAQLRLA